MPPGWQPPPPALHDVLQGQEYSHRRADTTASSNVTSNHETITYASYPSTFPNYPPLLPSLGQIRSGLPRGEGKSIAGTYNGPSTLHYEPVDPSE